MRPIHLAGGRQRDLYGPVISHRSSICIFMALSSEREGPAWRAESEERARRAGWGDFLALPKPSIPAQWRFSRGPLKSPDLPPVAVVTLGEEGR